MTTTITYRGSIRGVHVLARQLRDAGLTVDFDPPQESRGAGADVVHVLLRIASDVEAGVVGTAAVEAVRRIVATFRSRAGGAAEVELVEDAGQRS